VAIYRFTVSCIDQRDGLCLHSLHGGIFAVLHDVWKYVRFKWNYVALRKTSDNQQHLFLRQRRIIGNMMWMWMSSFIIKEDTGIVQ